MVYPNSTSSSPSSCFEVDSTESIWYTSHCERRFTMLVLKLTPQSQYGIEIARVRDAVL